MTNEEFKWHIDSKQYLMMITGSCCYLTGDGSCGYNSNFTSMWMPECKSCLVHFEKGEGAPVPDELKALPDCGGSQFGIWKAFQMIEALRIEGFYTDEQAAIVRETYAEHVRPARRQSSGQPTPEQRKRRILSALFG